MTDTAPHRLDAWGDFWADSARAGGGGCLPAAYRGIFEAQQQAWIGFARDLKAKARVLDLATGDGQVMRWLLQAKPGARLVGTDLANALPPPPKGTKVRPGVAMEALPFHAHAFDAVVSQFGFEYGDCPLVSAQISRVLKPGGTVALLTHRADGPILAYNSARAEQIEWVLDRRKLVEVAKNSLSLRASGIMAIPSVILQTIEDGARQFGERSVAWEIAEAIRQTLQLSGRDDPRNVATMLDRIEGKARNEQGRIASLAQACRTTQDDAAFSQALAIGGLQEVSRQTLNDRASALPFADFRRLRATS